MDLEYVKQQINEANKVYGHRFTTDDSMFYIEKYTIDAAAFPAQSPVVKGRGAIRNYYYDQGKNKSLILVIQAQDIYAHGGLVVEEGIYDFPDEKGGSFDKGKFIALWKEEQGRWKIFREIWNTDVAPGQ